MECKVTAPPDGDVVMSVCSVCTAQFYTQDPAVLATHLANHEIGINLKLFHTFCRICGMHPEDNIENHFKTAHAEEYRIFAFKSQVEDLGVEQKYHSENEVGYGLKTDASTPIKNEKDIVITRTGLNKGTCKGKVIKVKHNPKCKWKIIDLKEKQLEWQNKNSEIKLSKLKKLKETSSALDEETCSKSKDSLIEEIKQNCLYCRKELKLTSLPFHVLTQHKKLTFDAPS